MFDLHEYRRRSESFLEESRREHYLHLAGHKPELEIDADLRALLRPVRARGGRGAAEPLTGGRRARGRRYLLHFAFDGLVGPREHASRRRSSRGSRPRSRSRSTASGSAIARSPSELANEPDGDRRAALEAARDELAAERLEPHCIARCSRRRRAACRDFGWSGYADAYAELRGLDFEALAAQTQAFLDATERRLRRPSLDPELERAGVPPVGRAAPLGPAAVLPGASTSTAGFDGGADGPGARRDARRHGHRPRLAGERDARRRVRGRPSRRGRSARRRGCPEEIYLVVAPVGGRGDFDALFHEAGPHRALRPRRPAACRSSTGYLGDNAVTESFAFLIENLVAEPAWLGERARRRRRRRRPPPTRAR